MNYLEVNDLSVGYDKKVVLDNICFSLNKGEIISIIGPNGCGKTTLLKTLAGILSKKNGQIQIVEKDITKISQRELAKLEAVMLTEKKSFEYTTCQEIVAVGRFPYTKILGNLSKKDKCIIENAMRLTGVWELAQRSFDQISDGQRQRVLLARAIVQEPKLLILDEPTSFLDVGYKLEFMNICKSLAANEGYGILMSLHELDLAYAVSDRIITVFGNGHIDKIGDPKEILTKEYINKLFAIKKGSYSLKSGYSFDEKEIDNFKGKKTECSKADNCKIESINEIENINMESSEAINNKTHYIMVQGTMSNVGKSFVVAGLCRIFKEDGFRVAPFKSQNMALNSYITEDGYEMGRAQVMQAEACGIKPDVHMNPILLKPTSDEGSQVIVNGEVVGNMPAKEYFQYKKSLLPEIKKAINYLSKDNDIIVIEGAGSPVEINLKENDIVNMGMAKLVDSTVLLVGDIDRGGVFAQLLGTLNLLTPDELSRVGGLIINKFRGDKTILDPGVKMLEDISSKPVVGLLPYMNIKLEDEDSLTEKFEKKVKGLINISVIRLPRISNFTDFDTFSQHKQVSVNFVTSLRELENPDMLIIPGSKNTIEDMNWLREMGFEKYIKDYAALGGLVVGICGGFQMLGQWIKDPDCVESGGQVEGLGLLNIGTVLTKEKCRKQTKGLINPLTGPLKELSGKSFKGYEIHMGKSYNPSQINGIEEASLIDESIIITCKGTVYGTYVHGIFDEKEILYSILKVLFDRKGLSTDLNKLYDYSDFKERQYTLLAKTMRECLDLEKIYKMMGLRDEK